MKKGGVMIEHRATDILKPKPFSGVAEGLTGRSAGKKIEFVFFYSKFIFNISRRNV